MLAQCTLYRLLPSSRAWSHPLEEPGEGTGEEEAKAMDEWARENTIAEGWERQEDSKAWALKKQLHQPMIRAMPVMSVALSMTIVRDTQRVCVCTCLRECQYVGSGMDERRENKIQQYETLWECRSDVSRLWTLINQWIWYEQTMRCSSSHPYHSY